MNEVVCIHPDRRLVSRWPIPRDDQWEYEFLRYNLPPHGYGQRGDYPIPRKVTGRDGKPRCRWCLGPLEPPKRAWCSDACIFAARLRRDWSFIAEGIRRRDVVCQLCGGGGFRPTCWRRGYGRSKLSECPIGELEDVRGSHLFCRLRQEFEVDHIVAVSEGGTDDPRNLRLLCVPCHRQVTAEQRARWAEAKRLEAGWRPQLGLEL